jgi:hypothetical protein
MNLHQNWVTKKRGNKRGLKKRATAPHNRATFFLKIKTDMKDAVKCRNGLKREIEKIDRATLFGDRPEVCEKILPALTLMVAQLSATCILFVVSLASGKSSP